jgi:hypothetical protein
MTPKQSLDDSDLILKQSSKLYTLQDALKNVLTDHQ